MIVQQPAHASAWLRVTEGISMVSNRILASAAALACGLTFAAQQAYAGAADYRFQMLGEPLHSAGKDTVQVRLIHAADNKPVLDAVIFESSADMGPAGMETMTAPVSAMPAKDGIYTFEVSPGMTGTWALHFAAKVQGEPETIRGTFTAALVK
jgi:hypothetical protein